MLVTTGQNIFAAVAFRIGIIAATLRLEGMPMSFATTVLSRVLFACPHFWCRDIVLTYAIVEL
jgi:hypothetical protein